jgi:predicted GTPase
MARVEGIDKLIKTLKQAAVGDIEEIKAEITNNAPHINALEYGSKVGEQPWPSTGPKTEHIIDEYDSNPKIVSTQGYAMIRSSIADTKDILEKNLSKVNLAKPVRPQLVKSVNNAGAYLFREAVIKTPVDEDNARRVWGFKKAD